MRQGKGRTSFLLFVFLSALYLLGGSGRLCAGDDEMIYRVTRNLVERGDFALESETITWQGFALEGFVPTRERSLRSTWVIVPGRDGRYYSMTGLGQSLVCIPLYILGRWLPSQLEGQYLSKLFMSALNPLAVAATCALLLSFGRALGFPTLTALWLGLAYGFSSMAWVYTKNFYNQAPTTFLILAAVYAARRFRGEGRGEGVRCWLWLAGGCLGLAILFRQTSVLVALPLGLYLLPFGRRGRGFGRALADYLSLAAPIVCALLVVAVYNAARFGSPLETGYGEVAWDTPLALGVYGLLFSAGKGLFLYNPILLLGLGGLLVFYRKHRAETILFLALFVVYLFFHAPFHYWSGGWNWGPRFLLPVAPFLILPGGALLAEDRIRGRWALMIVLMALGLLIQLPAILVDHSRYLVCLSEVYTEEFYDKSIYEPAFSPIAHQWPAALEAVRLFSAEDNRRYLQTLMAERQARRARVALTENQISDELIWEEELFRLNVPDFWWIHLYLLGAPASTILVVVVFLVLVGGVSGLFLWRTMLADEAPGGGRA